LSIDGEPWITGGQLPLASGAAEPLGHNFVDGGATFEGGVVR
jgi:hypothetical protein